MKSNAIHQLTAGAMLIAIGAAIPMFSPLKIQLEPASFTLASHVAIFIAMFISPRMAGAVSIGTTLGFALSGMAPIIVLRAATHVVFAVLGAIYLEKRPHTMESLVGAQAFSLGVGIVHAACEVIVVTGFYTMGEASALYYEKGFLYTVMGLVGIGSVIHSMVDFGIAMAVNKALAKQSFMKILTSRAG